MFSAFGSKKGKQDIEAPAGGRLHDRYAGRDAADNGGGVSDYRRARAALESGDETAWRGLADDPDTPAEMLYYLARDGSADVRRAVAGNRSAPAKADMLLARGDDATARKVLAGKVGEVLPGLDDMERARVSRLVLEVVEVLAQDHLATVRAVIAEQIKHLDSVPADIARGLARDTETMVAAPVLEFSPLLTDADLVEIVSLGVASESLAAVARREGVSKAVSRAVAKTEDDLAVPALLANRTAAIGTETMEAIVEAGEHHPAWHQALVRREDTARPLVQRIASYVSEGLLADLVARNPGLEDDVAARLQGAVRRRMAQVSAAWDADDPEVWRAEVQHAEGRLTTASLTVAAAQREETFVVTALSLLTGLEPARMRAALRSRDGARVAVALSWRAALGRDFAYAVQRYMLEIPPDRLLYNTTGGDFPLGEAEMARIIALLER